ncbi:MAG: DUF4838 domain-containing protein [Victivallaceae bacterium]|jgi:hypothetical protein
MKLSNELILKAPNQQNDTLALAWNELQILWKKRFGDLSTKHAPIVLKIDFVLSPATNGFSVHVASDSLTFRASTTVDILYAIYDFAEEWLGFCFFEPGVDRVSHKTDSVELPDGRLLASGQPGLVRRGFIQEFPFGEYSYEIGDWMAKNKLNYLLTWMKYYDEMPEAMKAFYRLRGIEIESGHHNFNYWIPPEKYYQSHPDFFAVLAGRRISPTMDKSALLLSEQLCTTNPALRAEIVKNMVKYCRKHPEIRTISLIPNDGFGWCECERCSSFYDKNLKGGFYSVSAHVYKADKIYHDMVRDIVAQLGQLLPDVNVTFCAYVNYCTPAPGFRLEKNLTVHFAPYWRCINHRIDDADCPINSRYADDLDQWLNVKNGGEVNIYEYYMGINLYVGLPMVHHEDIFDEMAWYAKKGIDGVLTQFHFANWTSYGLNYYLMAKAAYGADKKHAVAAALQGIFGDDAAMAGEFYAATKKMVLSTGPCHIPYPYALFRRTSIEQYRELHALADVLRQRAPDDEFRRALVLWAEYLVRFKELFDRYYRIGVTVAEIDALRQWLHGLPLQIVVLEKVDLLFEAWMECVKTGRQWLHFNLEWEDEYIRRHCQCLNAINERGTR